MPHTKHKNGKQRAESTNAAKPEASAKPMTPPPAPEMAPNYEENPYADVAKDIAQLIQKHPIPAIAIGVGLGLVFARLLRS